MLTLKFSSDRQREREQRCHSGPEDWKSPLCKLIYLKSLRELKKRTDSPPASYWCSYTEL